MSAPLLIPHVFDPYTHRFVAVGSKTWCKRPYLKANPYPRVEYRAGGAYQPYCAFSVPPKSQRRLNKLVMLRGGNGDESKCALTGGDWVIVQRGDRTWRYARVSSKQDDTSKNGVRLVVQVDINEESKNIQYTLKEYPFSRVMIPKDKDAFFKQYQNVYYFSRGPNALPYNNALDHYFLRNGGREIDSSSMKDFMTCSSIEK